MTRWLAGVFDPSGRLDATRLPDALAPHQATVVDSPPLRVAHSGPATAAQRLVCLFDGHLDNAAELRRELGRGGDGAGELESGGDETGELEWGGDRPAHRPAGTEELLAAGYRRWGRALLPRLRGDFVLLVWDREQGEGLIARDQLGVRPFFLHDDGGGLRFASEIRQLVALLPRRPAPDPTSVAHWIAVSNRPGLHTLYSGIRRLGPGGVLLLSREGVREERYWSPTFEEPLSAGAEELAETMRTAMGRAVDRRLDADRLTGVMMSGGLDSSSIAALCAEREPDRVWACSATFPEHPAADESQLIEQLRRALSIPGLTAEVRPGGLLASALESLAAWQVPLRSWGDFWALPLLRAGARAGVGTMLGGDGGDELFDARAYLPADLLRAGRVRDAFALGRALPGAGERPARRDVVSAFGSLALLGTLPHDLHRALQRPRARRQVPAWLRPAAARALVRSDDPLAWKRLAGPRWWAHAAYGLTRRIEEGGVFEHHRRRAVLAGVESRLPLLDLDLVVLGLRQPPRATFDPHLSRPVLRASMAGLLPDAVRLRPHKALFESVIADCLRGPDLAAVRRLLADPAAEVGAYVELDGVRRALLDSDAEFRRSPFRWMWQVWRLVNAECWLRAQALAPDEPLRLEPAPSRPEIEVRPPSRSEPVSNGSSYVFPP